MKIIIRLSQIIHRKGVNSCLPNPMELFGFNVLKRLYTFDDFLPFLLKVSFMKKKISEILIQSYLSVIFSLFIMMASLEYSSVHYALCGSTYNIEINISKQF